MLSSFSGEFEHTKWLTKDKIIIKFKGPLDIILRGFYDQVANNTSPYRGGFFLAKISNEAKIQYTVNIIPGINLIVFFIG